MRLAHIDISALHSAIWQRCLVLSHPTRASYRIETFRPLPAAVDPQAREAACGGLQGQPAPHGPLLALAVSTGSGSRADNCDLCPEIETPLAVFHVLGHLPAAVRTMSRRRLLVMPSSHRPGSSVPESREAGPLRGLSRAPTALDLCPLLQPEVYGSGHNIRSPQNKAHTPAAAALSNVQHHKPRPCPRKAGERSCVLFAR